MKLKRSASGIKKTERPKKKCLEDVKKNLAEVEIYNTVYKARYRLKWKKS